MSLSERLTASRPLCDEFVGLMEVEKTEAA